ncbi:hypothetical protein Q3G72_010807 [Acer saccharum]|nr:hypothetical protein Q3G72_010807 [Acer saccharum]
MLRLDAAGYLSSSVASVVQPLDFSFTELLLSGVLALQLHYVWSLSLLQFSCNLSDLCYVCMIIISSLIFQEPRFLQSRKAAEHAAVNVAVMSFPFDGSQEASSLTESCHMPASVQRRFIVFSSNAHADCCAPSISDSTVWEGLQEQEVICSTTESGFIHVFQTFLFQMVLLCCKLAK